MDKESNQTKAENLQLIGETIQKFCEHLRNESESQIGGDETGIMN
jgi:hypothetical protein